MNNKTDTTNSSDQFVSFTLDREEYGIPIVKVQEIIRYENLTRVPQTPDFVEGVLNLRGQVIPVIDLRQRFGLSCMDHSDSSRIIVVEIDQRVVGLIVDSVTEVRTIEKNQIVPPPPMGTSVEREYIAGMGNVEERLVILLELNEIFALEEQETLSNSVR